MQFSADAKAKADSMIEEAQVQTTELVSEHEIMQQAYAQANEIVTQATARPRKLLIMPHQTRSNPYRSNPVYGPIFLQTQRVLSAIHWTAIRQNTMA